MGVVVLKCDQVHLKLIQQCTLRVHFIQCFLVRQKIIQNLNQPSHFCLSVHIKMQQDHSNSQFFVLVTKIVVRYLGLTNSSVFLLVNEPVQSFYWLMSSKRLPYCHPCFNNSIILNALIFFFWFSVTQYCSLMTHFIITLEGYVHRHSLMLTRQPSLHKSW